MHKLLNINHLSAIDFMRRKFVNNEVNHVYQRTLSGFNIFYEVEDYLVYYTIFSVMAVRYGVVVYGL